MAEEQTVWVLVDDRAGNRSQALGVADALGLAHRVKQVEYGGLARLPNFMLGASFSGLTEESRPRLEPPWPDLLIAAGRRLGPVARKIRNESAGETKIVQIMDPGSGQADFDLIAVPEHDPPVSGANVVRITGAPHGLTEARLEAARETWAPQFENLPRPWVALIVGGSTRRRQFTADMAKDLGRLASAMVKAEAGSLLVTTSRRTGDAAGVLIDALEVPSHVYRWGDEGENPYLGYLAAADAVIVTGDSVSMCSEACAAGGPVHVYAHPALITAKHERFHKTLFDGGYAKAFDGAWVADKHLPLNAAGTVATAIREKLNMD